MVVTVQLYHFCWAGCGAGHLDDCSRAGTEYDEYDDAGLVGDVDRNEHYG